MILFARHGNTFLSSNEAVWVGAQTDIDITSEGINQAQNVISYIKCVGLKPKRIITGPLKRTVHYSEIIANRLNLNLLIDSDLVEINYGLWEGLTDAEVIRRYGTKILTQWQENLIWPEQSCCWGESFEVVSARVQNFLNKLTKIDEDVIVCTSNGILRFVQYIICNQRDGRLNKVNTGNVCLLDLKENDLYIKEWNIRPVK